MFSLRIFGAPAMIQSGHNKNQSITASAQLLSGTKQKIYGFEMVRLVDKERWLLACLSVAVSSSSRSRLDTLCETDLDSLLSFPSANNLSTSALS
jgi:hypothetical protein